MNMLASSLTSITQPLELPGDHVFAGLQRNGYRCLLIDPPTQFLAGTKGGPQHYERITDAQIAALPAADLLHRSFYGPLPHDFSHGHNQSCCRQLKSRAPGAQYIRVERSSG